MERIRTHEFPCSPYEHRAKRFVSSSLSFLAFFFTGGLLLASVFVDKGFFFVAAFFALVIGLNVFLMRSFGRYALESVTWESPMITFAFFDRDKRGRVSVPKDELRVTWLYRKGGYEGLRFSKRDKHLFSIWFLPSEKQAREELAGLFRSSEPFALDSLQDLSQSRFAVIFLSFTFAPLGIFLLWTSGKFRRQTKILVTSLVSLPYLFFILVFSLLAPEPPLSSAIKAQDLPKIRGLLQSHPPLDEPLPAFRFELFGLKQPSPFLAHAIQSQNPEIVGLLLDHGATLKGDKDAIMYRLYTPGNATIFRLVDRRLRLPVGWRDPDGNTPLHLAEDKDLIALLVKEKNASLCAVNKDGQTPLAAAHARSTYKRKNSTIAIVPRFRAKADLLRSFPDATRCKPFEKRT